VLVPELEHAQAKPRIRHDFKMRGSSLRGRSSLEPRFGAQRSAAPTLPRPAQCHEISSRFHT